MAVNVKSIKTKKQGLVKGSPARAKEKIGAGGDFFFAPGGGAFDKALFFCFFRFNVNGHVFSL